jgi:hypothetical protein
MIQMVANHKAGVLMLVGLIFTGSAVAEPDFYKVRPDSLRAGATLILREHPKVRHSKKLGGVPYNADCIRNLGCQGGLSADEAAKLSPANQARRSRRSPRWCQIEYNGMTGWIQGRFLSESPTPSAECVAKK